MSLTPSNLLKNKAPPKSLIIGCNGYIGKHIYRYFKDFYPNIIGTTRRKDSFHTLDLSNPSLEGYDLNGYQYAIICAATSNIALCDKDPKQSFLINVLGPLNLAKKLLKLKIVPVFFSTDVVFDGTKEIYQEDSKPNPLNEYGCQKALLEKLLPKVCGDRYLILRITKTYSKDVLDSTFIFELIKKLSLNQHVKAASDLKFKPLLINDLISSLNLLLKHHKRGLYNICSTEETSWFSLAQMLTQKLQKPSNLIQEISIDTINPGIKRAKNLNLDTNKFLENFPEFKFTKLDFAVNQAISITQSSQPNLTAIKN